MSDFEERARDQFGKASHLEEAQCWRVFWNGLQWARADAERELRAPMKCGHPKSCYTLLTPSASHGVCIVCELRAPGPCGVNGHTNADWLPCPHKLEEPCNCSNGPDALHYCSACRRERTIGMCNVCAGTGKPVSGKPCICNGTGIAMEAQAELTKEVYELGRREQELREALRAGVIATGMSIECSGPSTIRGLCSTCKGLLRQFKDQADRLLAKEVSHS